MTCPHCGWTLVWKRDGSAHCHEDGVCTDLYSLTDYDDDKEHQVPYHPDMVRTKEGIQRYVVAPEISLKQMYDALQREWNIQCDLFPNFDSYDLVVKMPNGNHWAVDVKDWRNAVSLAIGVSQTPFRYLPEWDKAFYIFPTYRATQSYLNEFRNYWVPQKDVTFMSQHKFLEVVRAVAR